ncbi:hypothetical protein QWA68_010828 [Fusarium oxysporum]|nr:hypothetical protein QWA68_010828 [Fusarium oxysporum]
MPHHLPFSWEILPCPNLFQVIFQHTWKTRVLWNKPNYLLKSLFKSQLVARNKNLDTHPSRPSTCYCFDSFPGTALVSVEVY